MKILSIDPGNTKSAWLVYEPENRSITFADILDNNQIVLSLANTEKDGFDIVVIEMCACYGMPVGKEIFDTCVWIGRFGQAIGWDKIQLVYRKDVKMYLCNSMRAKDSNIRQALLDKFAATGGGKCPQIGTKSQPGPLYGLHDDLWSALAISVTYSEQLHLFEARQNA